MADKIDSYMLCSELELQSGYQMQSTISFGMALEHKKISKPPSVTNNNQSFNHPPNTTNHNISLREIFGQYLKDPLSTYTLELSSSKQIPHYMASKTFNEKYGKYTTSIRRQDFHNTLTNQHTQVNIPYSRTPKLKLAKISQLLKIIQHNSKQKALQTPPSNNLTPIKQTKSIQIKIQDMQLVNFDQKPQQNDKQNQLPESQVFLQLESNISNNCQSITDKLTFKNTKSQRKISQKQPLFPVPQNPQRKIFKLCHSNDKTSSQSQHNKGLILEFSKKLRKKTFNQKNLDQNVNVKPFEASY